MGDLDFDAARRERLQQRQPVTFTLGGQTFTCLPVVPFAKCWAIADAPDLAEAAQKPQMELMRILAGMIADMLIEEDEARWWDLFASKTEVIDQATLYDVASTLTERFAGRPTSPSTDSSDGRANSGGTSNEPVSPPVSVPSET